MFFCGEIVDRVEPARTRMFPLIEEKFFRMERV
jgi:hypothetical protein